MLNRLKAKPADKPKEAPRRPTPPPAPPVAMEQGGMIPFKRRPFTGREWQ
jgi:hypothetical protein